MTRKNSEVGREDGEDDVADVDNSTGIKAPLRTMFVYDDIFNLWKEMKRNPNEVKYPSAHIVF